MEFEESATPASPKQEGTASLKPGGTAPLQAEGAASQNAEGAEGIALVPDLEPPAAPLLPNEQGTALLPKYLSPSSASMFQQCPRKWKHRYVDKLPDPPGEPALAGTFAHRVLELLLQEPPERRTADRAKELAREVWPEISEDADFAALRLTEEQARAFRWRSWQAIEGLWQIEDPTEVVVEATEQDVQVTIGGVPFRGIIDRVDVESDGLVIADYKSGKAPSPRYTDDKLSQVLLYAAALAALSGIRPARARLLYLNQRIVEVDVTEENLTQVTTSLQQTWEQLQKSCETEEFEACTGPLCAWCPFVGSCPEGQVEVNQRQLAGRVRDDAPALAIIANAS